MNNLLKIFYIFYLLCVIFQIYKLLSYCIDNIKITSQPSTSQPIRSSSTVTYSSDDEAKIIFTTYSNECATLIGTLLTGKTPYTIDKCFFGFFGFTKVAVIVMSDIITPSRVGSIYKHSKNIELFIHISSAHYKTEVEEIKKKITIAKKWVPCDFLLETAELVSLKTMENTETNPHYLIEAKLSSKMTDQPEYRLNHNIQQNIAEVLNYCEFAEWADCGYSSIHFKAINNASYANLVKDKKGNSVTVFDQSSTLLRHELEHLNQRFLSITMPFDQITPQLLSQLGYFIETFLIIQKNKSIKLL